MGTARTDEITNVWEWLNANGGGLSATAAIVTALIAILALWGAARDSKDRTRPYVAAELRPEWDNHRAVNLIVTNYGATVASDVHVTFDPPITVDDADQNMANYISRRYSRPIPHISPRQELRNVWQSYREGPDGKGVPSANTPELCTVTIRYRGLGSRRTFRDTYTIDLKATTLTTTSRSSDSVPGYLKTIATQITQIANRLKPTS